MSTVVDIVVLTVARRLDDMSKILRGFVMRRRLARPMFDD